MYAHTYVHTYIPTCIPTYIQSYIHTYIHIYIHTCVYLSVYMYERMRVCVYVVTHLHLIAPFFVDRPGRRRFDYACGYEQECLPVSDRSIRLPKFRTSTETTSTLLVAPKANENFPNVLFFYIHHDVFLPPSVTFRHLN